MAKAKSVIPSNLQPWIEARRRFHLSHAEVQMARELGMNPKKLGSLDNHHQQPWKQPLPQFIATLYAKAFGRHTPVVVRSIEDMVALTLTKKQARKAEKAAVEMPALDSPD